MDPEELFRKIFGEYSGGRGFGDFNAIFEQPQEVSGMGLFLLLILSFFDLRFKSVSFLTPSFSLDAVLHGADLHSGSKGSQQRVFC